MADTLENERDIIRRCQAGDISAYKTLYACFEQPLLRLGLRMLGQQEDAEDAVQITFLRLYRSIRNFQSRSRLSTYLFRIMTNVCFDTLEKRKQDTARKREATEPVYVSHDALRFKLETHIATLPDRMRACFVLFAVEGFRQAEIADILNLSIGAVKAHIYQAKARLRKQLSDPQKDTPDDL